MLVPVSSTPEKKSDIPFHFDQGLKYMQQGDPYRAMGHILEVLRSDSTHSEALNAIGVICWNLYKSGHSFGQLAIEYLSRCIAKDPENRQAVLNLLTMWIDIYQSHKAKILCDAWLTRHPYDNEFRDLSKRISRAPSICGAERLHLHGKPVEPVPVTDQFGVYVGSTKYKLAYLVINKCACSTFRNLILSLDYQGDGGPLNNMITRYDNDFSLFCPKNQSLPDYFRFTFVRNPYSRVLSFYTDRILNDDDEKFITYEAPQYRSRFQANMPFPEFVERLAEIPMQSLEQHLAPQTYFLFSDSTLAVDFIGRLEKMDRDFQVIKNYLGMDITLPHDRKTTDRGHKKLITKETAAVLYQKYRIDFNVLGYGQDSWARI